MPHYAFLAETPLETDDIAARLRTLRMVGVPYTDERSPTPRPTWRRRPIPTADNDGLLKRYPKAVTVLDGNGRRRHRTGRAGRLSAGARHAWSTSPIPPTNACSNRADDMLASSCGCGTIWIVLVFAVFVLIVLTTYWPGRKSQHRAARPHPARRRPLRRRHVPTKIEKDIVTGQDTTGHEWDGLKELNTPLPKWWVYVLLRHASPGRRGLVRAVSVGARDHRLLPRRARLFAAHRGGRRCARGGGAARRVRWTASRRCRSPTSARIRSCSPPRRPAGRIAFADNCQPCHGAGGGGQPGYPALAAGAWIWGGTLDADPADHHATASAAATTKARAVADAALRRRWHAEAGTRSSRSPTT